MNRLGSLGLHVVLYEGPGSTPLGDGERLAILTALLEDGYAVSRPATTGGVVQADRPDLLVLGRFDADRRPRVEGLDRRLRVRFEDIGGLGAAEVLTAVRRFGDHMGASKPGLWKPWFPVIDFDRCNNCKQCLSFCLFGVYGVDADDQVRVQNPAGCKTDCPACSRVCPVVAIVFPKHGHPPINGDEVRQEELDSWAVKADVSALLGGDEYAALRRRSGQARKRFSTERGALRASARPSDSPPAPSREEWGI